MMPALATTAAPHVLAIGGSAGALDTVRQIVRHLPEALSIPVLIVLHLPDRSGDGLVVLLQADTVLTVKQAEDKEPLRPAAIYVAPPAYHLLVEASGTIALSIDEPVHFSRPAIDVLFESIRDAYGAHAIAVLLSGASADGAAGLQEIHAAGGVTIVQSPATTEFVLMPQAALALFTPTHVWTPDQLVAQLPQILQLATGKGVAS